jgi:hypothetical protein
MVFPLFLHRYRQRVRQSCQQEGLRQVRIHPFGSALPVYPLLIYELSSIFTLPFSLFFVIHLDPDPYRVGMHRISYRLYPAQHLDYRTRIMPGQLL